jgi:hypothetical protein
MKKLIPAVAIAVALFNAASAYAIPIACVPGTVAPGCPAPAAMPEPGSFVQLALGLLAVATFALVLRKRVRSNEAN